MFIKKYLCHRISHKNVLWKRLSNKTRKLLLDDDVNELPLRPIVTNIRTVTSETDKYLAKLLSPLGVSKYTTNITKQFVT